jgi:hypothetical protein
MGTGALFALKKSAKKKELPLALEARFQSPKILGRGKARDCGHLLKPLAMVRPVGCTPITLYCTCI